MSHVATVELEVRDLGALRAACASVGLEFREGQRTFRWFGKFLNDYKGTDAAFRSGIDPKDYGKCEHAIGVAGQPHAYEIGLVRKPNGAYALAWDFWRGGYGLEAVAGKGCVNLVRAYAGEVARRALLPKGYVLSGTRTLADGSTEMVFAHA